MKPADRAGPVFPGVLPAAIAAINRRTVRALFFPNVPRGGGIPVARGAIIRANADKLY